MCRLWSALVESADPQVVISYTAVGCVTQGVSMPAHHVPNFGLARLNSVRVGEEEEDVEFRSTLNAGITTDIIDLLQKNSPESFKVNIVQLVEHNCMSIFPACCPSPNQSERCYHSEECT